MNFLSSLLSLSVTLAASVATSTSAFALPTPRVECGTADGVTRVHFLVDTLAFNSATGWCEAGTGRFVILGRAGQPDFYAELPAPFNTCSKSGFVARATTATVPFVRVNIRQIGGTLDNGSITFRENSSDVETEAAELTCGAFPF